MSDPEYLKTEKWTGRQLAEWMHAEGICGCPALLCPVALDESLKSQHRSTVRNTDTKGAAEGVGV